MSLANVIRERLQRSADLYDELIRELPEDALVQKLPGLHSNTIGAQLWCVVGARESYSRAIQSGAWAGFSCSLYADGARTKAAVKATLSGSAETMLGALDGLDPDDIARSRLIIDLLEHEAAHQGQLIRYLYGLKLPIPPRWRARYALR